MTTDRNGLEAKSKGEVFVGAGYNFVKRTVDSCPETTLFIREGVVSSLGLLLQEHEYTRKA